MSFGKDDKEKAFSSAMGHKAMVERHVDSDEATYNAAYELQRIGQTLKQGYTELREHEYLGSMAVHIFLTPKLEVPTFLSQSPLGKTPEILASHALTDLKGHVMEEFYNRQRQAKRSKF